MTEPVLKIRDLTVEFGSPANPLVAVNHIDLEIPAKGCLGVVGESGSGKSITSLAIMRLIPEPPGRVVSGSSDMLSGLCPNLTERL